MLRVGKRGLHLERAGPGVYVVDRVLEVTIVRMHGVVGQDQLQRQRPGICEQLVGENFSLAHLEAHPDGVERHNRGERLSRIPRHEPTHLNQTVPDSTADRGVDRGVLQIELRGAQEGATGFHLRLRSVDLRARGEAGLLDVGFPRVDGGFVGLQGGDGVVEVLLRGRVFLYERPETLDVLPGLEQVGLSLREVRFGLRERYLPSGELEIRFAFGDVPAGFLNLGLVGAQVENIEWLPYLHIRPHLEEPLLHVPIDAGAHFHHVAGVCLRHVVAVDRHVLRAGFDDAHRRRRRRGIRCVPLGAAAGDGKQAARAGDAEDHYVSKTVHWTPTLP